MCFIPIINNVFYFEQNLKPLQLLKHFKMSFHLIKINKNEKQKEENTFSLAHPYMLQN